LPTPRGRNVTKDLEGEPYDRPFQPYAITPVTVSGFDTADEFVGRATRFAS
jgi:hypothetical protein